MNGTSSSRRHLDTSQWLTLRQYCMANADSVLMTHSSSVVTIGASFACGFFRPSGQGIGALEIANTMMSPRIASWSTLPIWDGGAV
jgi:hypothetical protein